QVSEARGNALEVPDVGDGCGELDVAHPVAANLRARDLDAAAFADDALEPDALVLPAVALPVAGWTEDALAEQAVLLRLQRPVVDGLGLLHLAVRPRPDLVGRRQSDPQFVKVIDVKHLSPRPFRVHSPIAATGSALRSGFAPFGADPSMLAPFESEAALAERSESGATRRSAPPGHGCRPG